MTRILATVVFLSFAMIGGSAFAQSSQHDGFYFGVDGTYDITKFDNFVITSNTDELPTDDKTIYNDEGPGAGIFIGFRMSQGNVTVGVEGRYGYSFIENEVSSTEIYKTTNEFGGSILPGFWVDENVIIFARVGFSQLTTERTFGGILNRNSDTGLHFGAGIEAYISDTLSLRGEYNRATYNHAMMQEFVDNTTNPATITVVTFDNNFRRDRFQVSIVSKF